MKTPSLLVVQASPRSARSQSRRLAQDFVQSWQAAHPAAPVVVRDLGHQAPPLITEAWVEGAFAPPASQSPAAREAIAVSDALVDEFLGVSEILIATPMYNLGVPAALKAWIDQIVRIGRTVALGAEGFQGLAGGRRVTIIVTSGSDFRLTGPAAGYNFVEPYLRSILGFIGLTNVHFVYAHSQNDGNPLREQALADARAAVRPLAAA